MNNKSLILKKHIVNFNLAKELKECGFNVVVNHCFNTYNTNSKLNKSPRKVHSILSPSDFNSRSSIYQQYLYSAPFLHEVIQWFKDHLYLYLSINQEFNRTTKTIKYKYCILAYKKGKNIILKNSAAAFSDKEECTKLAIYEACNLFKNNHYEKFDSLEKKEISTSL